MPFAPTLSRTHVVLRGSGFEADGLRRERGEVLDTSGWRNVKPLVDNRDLAPAPREGLATYKKCECERAWIDDESRTGHRCPARTQVN